MRSLLLAFSICLVISHTAHAELPVTAVEALDLKSYVGRWYDVRSIPNRFQKGCTNTTATYALNGDNSLRVENECTVNEDGERKVSRVVGKAWIKNEGGSKLKVSFACLFGLCTELAGGNYWVLALGPIENELYSWAIVGEPKRKYGWVLSRTPTLSASAITEIESRLNEQGYDPTRFASTPQEK